MQVKEVLAAALLEARVHAEATENYNAVGIVDRMLRDVPHLPDVGSAFVQKGEGKSKKFKGDKSEDGKASSKQTE